MTADSHFFLSLLGDAVCANCDHSWPCHRDAWGAIGEPSRCALCNEVAVYWHPPTQEDP